MTLDEAINALLSIRNGGVEGKTPITYPHPDSGCLNDVGEIRVSVDGTSVVIGGEITSL